MTHELISPEPMPAPAWLSVRERDGQPLGAEVADGVPFEEWAAYASALLRFARSVQWVVGDVLNAGERLYGEQYAQVLEAADYESETLRACGWVAGRIPPVRRRTALTWSHHKEVAGLDAASADELLARAESEGLSTRALRKLAGERQRPVAARPAPEPAPPAPPVGLLLELLAVVEKLRAAQRMATEPASYSWAHDASTAAIYERSVDELVTKINAELAKESPP